MLRCCLLYYVVFLHRFTLYFTLFSQGVLLVITPQVSDQQNLPGKEPWRAVDIIQH